MKCGEPQKYKAFQLKTCDVASIMESLFFHSLLTGRLLHALFPLFRGKTKVFQLFMERKCSVLFILLIHDVWNASEIRLNFRVVGGVGGDRKQEKIMSLIV